MIHYVNIFVKGRTKIYIKNLKQKIIAKKEDIKMAKKRQLTKEEKNSVKSVDLSKSVNKK